MSFFSDADIMRRENPRASYAVLLDDENREIHLVLYAGAGAVKLQDESGRIFSVKPADCWILC